MKEIFFKGVALDDSWVLGWRFDSVTKKLIFDLNVSLWQGCEYYVPPLPGEYTCYRRGTLTFDQVTNIDGLLPMDTVQHSISADGTIDFENIEQFQQVDDNTYRISGDFGEVSVRCSNVKLEINVGKEIVLLNKEIS